MTSLLQQPLTPEQRALYRELVRRGLKIPPPSRRDRDWSADPVGYVREVLQVEPWEKQRQILEAVRDHRRVAVRSCHSSGKTVTAACLTHWWLHSWDPALVLSTAPTARQVKDVLWNQIGRLHRKAGLPGTLNTQDLVITPSRRAFGFSTNEPERMQGWHEANILVIVDEASGVAEEIYESVEGILTSENARLLLIGNPNNPAGTFYNAFRSPLYHQIHISAFDVPDPPLPPGWKEERRQEWGEESPVYQVRVLGEFPDQAEDALIAMRWVTSAMERWADEEAEAAAGAGADRPEAGPGAGTGPARHEGVVIGVDVARYGGDESVLVVRRGHRVLAIDAWRGNDTMATAGRVRAVAREWNAGSINVDEIGIGAGVLDRLRSDGCPAVGVNVGEAAWDSEHYANRRAEIFFALQERFKTGDISLPDDSTLLAQLTSLKFVYTPQGKLKIESKEDMRKRGLPSPDRADALALCMAPIKGPSPGIAMVSAPRPSGGFQWRT